MFRHILENELSKRNISYREAAAEIGISHSTLTAARDGSRRLDVETALRIARWMNVPLSTLIDDFDPEKGKMNSVVQAIQLVISAAPELEQVFLEAAGELESGVLSMTDFRDITEYAAYKIRTRKEQAQRNAPQSKIPTEDR